MSTNRQRLAERLWRFAAESCPGESPLYEHLCTRTAEDQRLLDIVRATPEGQPVPNLFLAAVHHLLLAGVNHELAGFYPSCTANPRPPKDAFPAFRDFCLAHKSAIQELMSHRRVQTNEVRRCAHLYPAFSRIAREAGRPLALIDVGTSAGLNLVWDRYSYDYGTGNLWGRPNSGVRITTELRGGRRLPLPAEPPPVAWRVGLDVHVPEVSDPAENLWLRSLVWPDQPHRAELLNAAMDEFRHDPPTLIAGDAFDLLPGLIRQAPPDAKLCVSHCHTLNQLSDSRREEFGELLAEASRDRPLVQLSAEWIRTPTPELWLTHWNAGRTRSEYLASVDHHGRWVEWLANAP